MTIKKIQATDNTDKKPFRKSGEALRVRMCRVGEPDSRIYLDFANRSGQRVYTNDQWYCVDVYGGGQLYQAPDAKFQAVQDGTYVHQGDGRFVRM